MADTGIKILIIEDNPADFRLVAEMLKASPEMSFDIKNSARLGDALNILKDESPDVIFLDLDLPDSRGLAGLEKIIAGSPGIPVIVLTGIKDENLGVLAVQKRASDYLVKDQINSDILVRSIRYSIERKQVEDALNRSNRTLKALKNSSQAMMYSIDEEDEQEYLNKICEIIVNDCGYSMVWIGYAENAENKTVRPVAQAGFEDGYLKTVDITWADTERGRGPTGTAIRTGKISMCKNMLTDPAFKPWREEALKRGYASSVVFPLIAGEKTIGAISIYSKEPDPFSDEDIKLLSELADDLAYGIMTIRLRAENEQAMGDLKRTSDYLENLINYANAPIIVWDPQFKITRFNRAFEQFTDYNSSQIIGRELSILFPENSREESLGKIMRTLAGEYWESVEVPILTKNGDVRIALWNSANIYGDDGSTLLATIAQGQDITERKKAEEILKNENLKLQELDRQKSEFVSIVAHDLRTPLTSIMGFADTLARKNLTLSDRQKETFIGYIQEESRRVSRLISDFLDISKIEDGKLELKVKKTDIKEIINKTIEVFRENTKEIKLSAEFERNLPEVHLDEDRLRQVLENLIGNGIKYTPAKSEITVAAKKDPVGIRVEVIDGGPGITDEEKEKIFKRFYRVESDVIKRESGVGLGLAIVRAIIEKHGGKIWVENNKPTGSRFIFVLPVKN